MIGRTIHELRTGAIYLSQSLKFLKPVKLGDTITARRGLGHALPRIGRLRAARYINRPPLIESSAPVM